FAGCARRSNRPVATVWCRPCGARDTGSRRDRSRRVRAPTPVSKPAWQFIVASLALLAVALLIGLIAGRPLAFVALALGLMLLRHGINLLRFDRWLRSRTTRPAPHFG